MRIYQLYMYNRFIFYRVRINVYRQLDYPTRSVYVPALSKARKEEKKKKRRRKNENTQSTLRAISFFFQRKGGNDIYMQFYQITTWFDRESVLSFFFSLLGLSRYNVGRTKWKRKRIVFPIFSFRSFFSSPSSTAPPTPSSSCRPLVLSSTCFLRALDYLFLAFFLFPF